MAKAVGSAFVRKDEYIIAIGNNNGHLGASLYLREVEGKEEGCPPNVDLKEERENGEFIFSLIKQGKLTSCHDISDGGLYVAITEMSIRSKIGCHLDIHTDNIPLFAYLFAEDQGCYLITVMDSDKDIVLNLAAKSGVKAVVIGRTTGKQEITLNGEGISINELIDIYESVLPRIVN